MTNLKAIKVKIKLEKIKKPLYEFQIKIEPDKLFIKIILQRHVLETIFKFINKCFSYPAGEDYLSRIRCRQKKNK
jgi:hypothetical protein